MMKWMRCRGCSTSGGRRPTLHVVIDRQYTRERAGKKKNRRQSSELREPVRECVAMQTEEGGQLCSMTAPLSPTDDCHRRCGLYDEVA